MKKLLLADTHLPTVELLESRLSQAGYEVRVARDPTTAMEEFVAYAPDAALVAVDFPPSAGAHLAQHIGAWRRGPPVPVIAIDKGHLGMPKGVEAILDLKVNAYVADPLRGSELLAKLGSLLAAAGEREALRGLRLTLSRSPVLAGDLKDRPLPMVLHSLYRLSRDGVLVVDGQQATRRVFFREGAPVNYDSTARRDSFLHHMRQLGLLTAEQEKKTLVLLGHGALIAAALVEVGSNLEGEEFLRRVREYVRYKVSQLVGMKSGRYAFFAGSEFLGEVETFKLAPLAAIFDGARRSFPMKFFTQALRPHLSQFPMRTALFGSDVPALDLDPRDLRLALQINGTTTLRDFLAHGRSDLRLAASLMWWLTLTGDVVYSATPVGESKRAPEEPQTPVPRRQKPFPPESLAELQEEGLKILTGSYFGALGLDIAATTEAVEEAYRRLATKFHPDTYVEFDLSSIQNLLADVQDKLLAASKVLSVETKRRAYLEYLFSRLETNRAYPLMVDAEVALRRGLNALKRGDAKSATLEFEEAIRINPKEPEYYCSLAWATYRQPLGEPADRAKEATKLLKKALALDPKFARAEMLYALIEGETDDPAGGRQRLLALLNQRPDSELLRAALRSVSR